MRAVLLSPPSGRLAPGESIDLSSLDYEVEPNEDFIFRFYFDSRKTDIVYLVEASSDLSSWEEVLFDSSEEMPYPLGLSGMYEVEVNVKDQSARFLKLRIEPR